jgi:hypothetical protein
METMVKNSRNPKWYTSRVCECVAFVSNVTHTRSCAQTGKNNLSIVLCFDAHALTFHFTLLSKFQPGANAFLCAHMR